MPSTFTLPAHGDAFLDHVAAKISVDQSLLDFQNRVPQGSIGQSLLDGPAMKLSRLEYPQ